MRNRIAIRRWEVGRLMLGLALGAAAAALLSTRAEAGSGANSVSGRFVLDGTATAPAHAAAFRVRDRNHAREWVTYVLLSGAPVQSESIAADIDPYLAAINDPAVLNSDHLSLMVRADGTVSLNANVGGVQYVDSSGSVLGMKGSLDAQCTSNTESRVTCTVKTAQPVKSMDGPSWTLDIAIDVAVPPRPAGKPVGKDGGAPGAAFMQLAKALKGNSLDAVLAGLSADVGKDHRADYNTPEENLKDAQSRFEFALPKQPRIIGGELLGDSRALLEVEGVPYEGAKALHLIEMTREDGRWTLNGWRQIGFLD